MSGPSGKKDLPALRKRYKTDPAYRERELKRAREAHAKNKVSKNYRALTAQRKKIYWTKESIARHRTKLHALQQRLRSQTRWKEELELRWGKERAEAKRAKREAAQRNVAEPRIVANPLSPDVESNPNTASCES